MKLKNIIVIKNKNRTVLQRLNKKTGVYCYVAIPTDKSKKPFIIIDTWGRKMLYKDCADYKQLN